MLIAPLSVATDLSLPATGRPGFAPVLHAYEQALRSCSAEVERVAEDELAFRVSVRAPQRLSISEPDLGLVSRGTVVLVPTEAGYRVHLSARPRSWVLVLSLVPWMLLVWGLGLAPAPWHYVLAYGGFPLFVLLWTVTWANLHAFLDHTNRAFLATSASAATAAQ